MGNNLLNKADENVIIFFNLLERIEKGLEKFGKDHRLVFNGEIYLTDKDLSKRLRISRRTLQEYRTVGKIPYYMVCGKVLYKESEIEKILSNGYKKTVENDDLV
ncbi:hypothetical protein EZS27_024329 [termite gut metagenome]|uniref:Helix-turn-helix domain-containing protein n=1 Tax=termite gut metagenome TaxID=433724 RepID=A0A5J4QYX5_9ZZZZ